MSLIYLIRHASPDRTRTDLPYHLLPGPPLTMQGVGEAQELGEFLRLAGVVRLASSPLDRCLHTARIAAGVAGASLSIEPDLKEWQPEERSADVRSRIRRVFDALFQFSRENGPAALLSHGGPIGALLQELGMSPEAFQKLRIYDYGNILPPASAWLAQWEADDRPWRLSLAFIPKSHPAPVPSWSPGPQLNSPN